MDTQLDIRQNVSLKDYSTMRLGGNAAYLVDIHDRNELKQAVAWAEQAKLPVLMIGGGSNIIWRDEGFSGLIMVNKIMRFEEQQEDEENYYVTVGAGENWDSVVARTVQKGMTGIEALSLIPGTAGATPIQNVGAYGQEIAQTLVSVEVFDLHTKQMMTIPAMDCAFSYRNSRFKSGDRGRFLITGLTLHLMHANPVPPFYGEVQAYFEQNGIAEPTPQALRDAVIAIRQAKLPDPATIPNTGSFFANPIIDEGTLAQLQADNGGNIPHWPQPDGSVKIPAAWLVEQAGLKGVHDTETGMATWQNQALVLVNEHAETTAQLLTFKQKIVDKVQATFTITLMQEPELLP
ncbi:MAG TPA: UDP-N-acetylmuramate dehydrogenase [Candidatus Saccharimonadales bacterium]|nr:UDP-N-acetylmuramate dehydrogenase [Candidatus Saccharimonadales bacterium]